MLVSKEEVRTYTQVKHAKTTTLTLTLTLNRNFTRCNIRWEGGGGPVKY